MATLEFAPIRLAPPLDKQERTPPGDTRRHAVASCYAGLGIVGHVTDTLPPCPQCSSEYTYEMGALLVCPECAHEWEAGPEAETTPPADLDTVVKDSVGKILADGDTVTIVKTLKVKGNPTPIKAGTKVRSIRLVDGVDGHNIDCKIDGFGAMQLKSSVVKKV